MDETVKDPWKEAISRLNNMTAQYATMITADSFYSAFSRASLGMMNQPQIQNRRIKGISSLPADYTKEDIGEFARSPYLNETPLRQTSEALKWTNYPYFKINKTYQDIGTYRYYAKPLDMTAENAKDPAFAREATLIDKFNREFNPSKKAHEATGKALSMGKVAYFPRYKIDKAHNKVLYAFWQQLPEDWITLIGYNNISGYTVSFNMMYFLQPGTDVRSFGEGDENLFAPFLDDFNRLFVSPSKGSDPNIKYLDCKNGKIPLYYNNYDPAVYSQLNGSPKLFQQNGKWAYWVSLPVDKVWVFEIDDTTPAMASPLTGLFITYAQQADYEAAQLSLLLNPLIKIFTGEIDLFDDPTNTEKDILKISPGLQEYYTARFNQEMARNNTGGAAVFAAPYKNIKSHDYSESANANEISSSFNKYAGSKAGLNALIPVTDDIKAAQVKSSQAIEARFATACIYNQFERMMRQLYRDFKLRYDFDFVMFGDIFFEEDMRNNAKSAIDKGDLSAYFILCALDGQSWLEKISMMNAIRESGLTELLQVPPTAYTQSGGEENTGGRPKTEDISESKEKAIDMGVVEE